MSVFELNALPTYCSQPIDKPSRLVDNRVYITRVCLTTLFFEFNVAFNCFRVCRVRLSALTIDIGTSVVMPEVIAQEFARVQPLYFTLR